MVGRRQLLLAGATALGVALLPRRSLGTEPSADAALAEALAESDLIYVSPLLADGRESRCQAEVWFVAEGSDAYVVTASDAWRARAPGRGLDRARVWVGDVGVWTRSDGAYRELPSTVTQVTLITDPTVHARQLAAFGDKYPVSWVLWGPRFRRGLADGSRVMLRYRPLD